MSIGLVWAQSTDGVIGVGDGLPWHLPEDLAHFKALTAGSLVVMGHTTWRSLPERFRPLPGRRNVVLSRRPGLLLAGATVVPDVPAALALAAGTPCWVIGGGQVYAAVAPLADRAEVTDVDLVVGHGTAAPGLGAGWHLAGQDPAEGWHTSSTGLRYRFRSLVRTGAPDDGAGR